MTPLNHPEFDAKKQLPAAPNGAAGLLLFFLCLTNHTQNEDDDKGSDGKRLLRELEGAGLSCQDLVLHISAGKAGIPQ